MKSNVYILEWYGPFKNPEEVLEWEKEGMGEGKTYLYLFRGKKPKKRNFSYYCGQAFEQSSGKRMTNRGHHINEVIDRPAYLDIWVGKFYNLRPKKHDVNLVENLITSVMSQAIIADEKAVLNCINKSRPRSNVYVINEWFDTNGNPIERYRKGTLPSVLHDVIICYYHEDTDTSSIYGNKHKHAICELEKVPSKRLVSE